MLDLRQYTRNDQPQYPEPLYSLSQRTFPRTPQQVWELEQELYQASARLADAIFLEHLLRTHDDQDFVKQAIEEARTKSPHPLIHKGWKEVSVLLLGGSRVVFKTPYLREDLRGKRGRKRGKRREKGSGLYPVLEALGIRDGVSPATRSELALYTVQAASYQEAVRILESRGIDCDLSTVVRIASATAQADISLREAALSGAMNLAVPANGALAGQRVRVSVDGGRVRTRRKRQGRKTRKGRHGFSTAWREPRVVVIDILDEAGQADPLRLPLYDALIADADAIFSLLVGYLRLLGAAHAAVVEFIADGAEWIWERVGRLVSEAEIPESILVEVVDFYHASEHLAETVNSCPGLGPKEGEKLYQKLRHTLRHEPEGVQRVIEQLKELDRGKKLKKSLSYFEKHAPRMQYAAVAELKLSIGSGQVESTVRRVINLRFKAAGSFWKEERVNGLMHLRANFKAGRWDELMRRVLNREFGVPSFDAIERKSGDSSRAMGHFQPSHNVELDEAA